MPVRANRGELLLLTTDEDRSLQTSTSAFGRPLQTWQNEAVQVHEHAGRGGLSWLWCVEIET